MAKFQRSFKMGVGSVISLKGGDVNFRLGSLMTDAKEIKGDWEAVGNDLRMAYEEVNRQQRTSHP